MGILQFSDRIMMVDMDSRRIAPKINLDLAPMTNDFEGPGLIILL